MLIDAAFDGRTVDLPVGQVVELRLSENPTTGYRWVMAAPPGAACAVVDDAFHPAEGPVSAGQSGAHQWRIEARQEGDCDLAFASRRSFEPNGPAAATFQVRIHVKPKA